MIPSAWVGVVLALAAFRLTRLVGWDDLPPIARVRAWALGERVEARSRPGGQDDAYLTLYRRPLLAHLVHCPFCVGWWVSLALYIVWLWLPTETLYAAAPLALSAAVGLIAKNLDP